MKHILTTIAICLATSVFTQQDPEIDFEPSPLVDFDAYLKLAEEVKEYRKGRLVSLDQFNAFAKEENTVILDTRSAEMYEAMHVKGTIHLDFTDFTQDNLDKLIPSRDTRILIYCNNNFNDEPDYFTSKVSRATFSSNGSEAERGISLALNIPTFINLYGYGFRNVYELGEMVSVYYPVLQLEGKKVHHSFFESSNAIKE